MQAMLEKQIKMTQTVWEIVTVENTQWIMKIDHSELYYQIIKIQEINYEIWIQFNHDNNK